jgi:carbon storage regulator CsrA
MDGWVPLRGVRAESDQVKLGIQAPKDVPVHREEIQAGIDRGRRLPSAGLDSR